MKKTVIIADQNTIGELYLLLKVLVEPVEILRIYGVGKVDFQSEPIADIQDLPDIRNLPVDFVLNDNGVTQNVMKVLAKLGYEEDKNVFCKKSFLAHYMSPEEQMSFAKEKIAMHFPASRSEGARVTLGDFTYGSPYILNDVEGVWCHIGKFCSIAENVVIMAGGEHRVDWITTYPFNVFMEGVSGLQGHPTSKGDVIIGNDVWIGYGSIILSGVEVGDGVAIAAGSVVTKSIPPYTIVGGNPARVIRKRFSEDIVEALLSMKWWDWSYEQIFEAIPLLQDDRVEELIGYWRSIKHAG